MKSVSILLALVGVLLALAGLVFTLQGMGIVGPDGSFMFASPTWVYQGIAVMTVGILTLLGALYLSWKQRPRKP